MKEKKIPSTAEEWLGNDNKLGQDIWHKKYQYKNESVQEFFNRVSGGDEEMAALIAEKKALFGGRINSNRGTEKKASLSNCYTLGKVPDSLEEIMEASRDIAMTFKSQGGQGLSLSLIRPKGCGVLNGQFKSDGIVPFMEIFNQTTASVSQGGSRKGALIMTLDAWHAEAERFITIKTTEGKIEKANLSLEIDDEFMEAVEKYYNTGEIITKKISRDYEGNHVEYEVTPIEIYKKMIETAWDWGEPGCIFTNRFCNYNIMEKDEDYNIVSPNPCGEQPLPAGGACCLASINLAAFVKNPFKENAEFDIDGFLEATAIVINALDQVVSDGLEGHALKVQRDMAYNYRNIGLGIMGLYDAIVKMGMKYGSEKSIIFADEIMYQMFRTAFIASVNLAKKKGAFPKYKPCILESEIVRNHFTKDELEAMGAYEYGLRNCSLLSIAPAGSIATMLNVSTGIEPAFSISYKRRTQSLNGEGNEVEYDVYTGVAKEYKDMFPGSELPDIFVTAGQIPWKERINMQATIQDHVDTGISSTVNLPYECSVEDVELLYLFAWKQGCKGITIFRDGCKRLGILTNGNKEEKKEEHNNVMEAPVSSQIHEIDESTHAGRLGLGRGDTLHLSDDEVFGLKRKIHTGCGNVHVECNFSMETGELYETFFNKGSKGGCASLIMGLSRLASKAVRDGMPVDDVIDALQDTNACPSYVARHAKYGDTSRGTSCPTAICYAIADMQKQAYEIVRSSHGFSPEESYDSQINDYMDNDNIDTEYDTVQKKKSNIKIKPSPENVSRCPDCSSRRLRYEGGCVTCPDCGWSRCG